MNTKTRATHKPGLNGFEPLRWWQEQWLQNATPLARMQLAWMESMAAAMQSEAEFFTAMAESGLHLADSVTGEDAPLTPAEFQEQYQKLAQDLTDAHLQRLQDATELSTDFRRKIWEEI